MDINRDIQEVTVKGRKYVIRKFDARTGSYLGVKLLALITPILQSYLPHIYGMIKEELPNAEVLDKLNKLADADISSITKALMNLSEQDFFYIQDKCLQVCSELLPSGPTPIMNDNRTFGVIGLENDVSSVMALTVHALMFNMSSFFGEGLLTLKETGAH